MNKYFAIIFLCCGIMKVSAQKKDIFTLQQVIQLAQSQSPMAQLALTQKEVKYYQYLSYKSDFNPQIAFYGNLPVYNKEYFGVRQPDGSISYQSISQNNNNVGLSLSQQIPYTGGELSLNTDLNRFEDFRAKNIQYNGTPVYLKLSQSLFGFNAFKWQKKIEPLKYEESKRELVQEMESIAQQVTNLYFNVLDAHGNIQIAKVNLENAEANFINCFG